MCLPASENSFLKEVQTSIRPEIRYGKGVVLLVDDEEIIINIEKKMLDRLGYDVLVARSGREALDLYDIHKHEIDLVILDMVMPGLGGGETYNRLKEIDEDVNVILSSGYDINEPIKEILDRGCKGFLQKPFSLNELSTKIKQMKKSAEGNAHYR